MSKNKTILAGLVAGMLFVGAGCSWWNQNNTNSSTNNGVPNANTSVVANTNVLSNSNTLPLSVTSSATTTNSVIASTTPTSTKITTIIPKKSAVRSPIVSVAPTTKYVDALNIYRKSGYYFQFSKCHGNPGTLFIKKGVKFMLDNRDNDAHTITINKVNYRLTSYGFAVAVAPSSPAKYYITCDGGGAAVLRVEN